MRGLFIEEQSEISNMQGLFIEEQSGISNNTLNHKCFKYFGHSCRQVQELTHLHSEFLWEVSSATFILLKIIKNKAKVHKIFEGEFLFNFRSTFLLQIFSKKCFCQKYIFKIVRPVLAALSVNGLRIGIVLSFTTKYVQTKTGPIVPLEWVKTHVACKDWELQLVCDVRVPVHVARENL